MKRIAIIIPIALLLVYGIIVISGSCPHVERPNVALPHEISGPVSLFLGQHIDSVKRIRDPIEYDGTYIPDEYKSDHNVSESYKEWSKTSLMQYLSIDVCSSHITSIYVSRDHSSQSGIDSIVSCCKRAYGLPDNTDTIGADPLARHYRWHPEPWDLRPIPTLQARRTRNTWSA